MKTIKYIIATTLISAVLFTGCKKEDSMENGLTNPTANATTGQNANITYQIQVLVPPAGPLIRWNAGTMQESKLVFDGAQVFGNMLQRDEYTANENTKADLFSDPVLGSVSVPFGFYRATSYKVQLNSSAFAPLSLSGACNVGGSETAFMLIPVQFIVYTPLTLQSGWTDTVMINKANYLSTLTLDLSQLTNGISAGMLSGAVRSGGTILITNTSNVTLYNIMLNNLQNYMMGAQLSAQPQATSTPSSPNSPAE